MRAGCTKAQGGLQSRTQTKICYNQQGIKVLPDLRTAAASQPACMTKQPVPLSLCVQLEALGKQDCCLATPPCLLAAASTLSEALCCCKHAACKGHAANARCILTSGGYFRPQQPQRVVLLTYLGSRLRAQPCSKHAQQCHCSAHCESACHSCLQGSWTPLCLLVGMARTQDQSCSLMRTSRQI